MDKIETNDLRMLHISSSNSNLTSEMDQFLSRVRADYHTGDIETTGELTGEGSIGTLYYQTYPHLILLEVEFYQSVGQSLSSRDTVPPELFNIPLITADSGSLSDEVLNKLSVDFGSYHYAHLNFADEFEELLDTFDETLQEIGFMTETGDVDNRLVQRHLDVEMTVPLSQGGEVTFSGVTTGLNLNGLGGRFKVPETVQQKIDSMDQLYGLLEEVQCKIQFQDDEIPLMPANGVVERAEESWDGQHDLFLAIEFDDDSPLKSDSQSRQVLEGYIEKQEEKSIRRQDDS